MRRYLLTRFSRIMWVVMAALAGTSACARGPDSRPANAPAAPTHSAHAQKPLVVVHKSPSCGCCGKWVEHLEQAGFPVEVRHDSDLSALKSRLGIPPEMVSCHTAEVDGYVIEGHAPVTDLERLLAERPPARGLVLPGMPLGSPGMEVPNGRKDAFSVELLDKQGNTRTFQQHPSQ